MQPVATVLEQGGVLLSLTDDFHMHLTTEAAMAFSEMIMEAALIDAGFEWEEADQ